MPAIHQNPLFKVPGNPQLFQDLANGRFWPQVKIKLFLACGGIFGQIGKEMHVDGHTAHLL